MTTPSKKRAGTIYLGMIGCMIGGHERDDLGRNGSRAGFITTGGYDAVHISRLRVARIHHAFLSVQGRRYPWDGRRGNTRIFFLNCVGLIP